GGGGVAVQWCNGDGRRRAPHFRRRNFRRRLGTGWVLPWPRPGVARQRTNGSLRLRYRAGHGHDRGAMDAGESGGSAHGLRAELNLVKKTMRIPRPMEFSERTTNSAAIAGNGSLWPSAERCSIATVRPSIHPSSRSRCTKAATDWPKAKGVLTPRKPIVGNLLVCCARPRAATRP